MLPPVTPPRRVIPPPVRLFFTHPAESPLKKILAITGFGCLRHLPLVVLGAAGCGDVPPGTGFFFLGEISCFLTFRFWLTFFI